MALTFGNPGASMRKKLDFLRAQLENERTSFEGHWRDLSDYVLPRRYRGFISDTNKGDRRTKKIIDSTATLAARTLRSGMMAGITSPARPWFRLTTPDPALAELSSVKEWLDAVTKRLSSVFLRSNLYNVLPTLYGDIGVFSVGAIFLEEDFDRVIHAYSLPVGSYWIANDSKGRVRVFHREFRMTVRQIVEEYGVQEAGGKPDFENISTHVKALWDQGDKEAWIDICHTIIPNPDYAPKKTESKFKAFRSLTYEKGGGTTRQTHHASLDFDEKFLRDKGYDFFPVLAPRWEVAGEDSYGTTCPGMEALGDIKQLQLGEKRGMQAIEKMVNPPMVAPHELKTQRSSLMPGDITYANEREGQKGFRPAHEVNLRIQELEAKQDQVRFRIRKAFFEDLFLMLASTDRRQITAREVEERHEEKLLALGPVLERLNQDLLDPLIDITFDIMLRQNLLPPPPEELLNVDLKVEYVSIMAQAQKLVDVAGLERFAGTIINMAAAAPAILDKIDLDQWADVYGDRLSVPPDVIRPDDEVDEIREQRAAAQQAAAQAEQAAQAASAAKDLSDAKLEDDSALRRIADQANAGRLVEGP